MAFADPQSITISAVTKSLPRVSTGEGKAEYWTDDGAWRLLASNSYGNRTRRVLRLDHSKVTADAFIPEQNRKVSMSVYTVFDLPAVGYTNAEALAVYQGFKTQVSASSDLLITKLLGGES